VAPLVVDALEVVEVEGYERDHVVEALSRSRAPPRLLEATAVEEPG
jgi:hypothetical protein